MLRGKVYATLIIGVVFFMSGGVSLVVGETLIAELEIIEVIEVELIKVTEPEFLKVTEFEFMEVTEPEFIEITEPEFLERWVDVDGRTKRGGKPKSVEQIMCGLSNGLPTPKKCLFVGQ